MLRLQLRQSFSRTILVLVTRRKYLVSTFIVYCMDLNLTPFVHVCRSPPYYRTLCRGCSAVKPQHCSSLTKIQTNCSQRHLTALHQVQPALYRPPNVRAKLACPPPSHNPTSFQSVVGSLVLPQPRVRDFIVWVRSGGQYSSRNAGETRRCGQMLSGFSACVVFFRN